MISSESLVAQDISLKLKDDFSLVQNDSTIKRIHRLMRNERYEGHKIRKQTEDLASYQFKSKVYKNVKLFENHDFETNIIRSKRKGVSESWIIATNGDVKRTIKDYGYRFGGI